MTPTDRTSLTQISANPALRSQAARTWTQPSAIVIVRADSVVHLTARYTIETNGGGLILVNAEGYRHGPPDVMERLARDETVDPALYYFRTFMRFETADPGSAWLNRILAIGRGARANRQVRTASSAV